MSKFGIAFPQVFPIVYVLSTIYIIPMSFKMIARRSNGDMTVPHPFNSFCAIFYLPPMFSVFALLASQVVAILFCGW